ncbi:hypothetical protein ACFLY9_02855 [Patescibacteria group bacterium]
MIPIRIVAEIVVTIASHVVEAAITNKEPSDKSDERDKLIGLKATRNSHYVFCIGMLLAIILVALGKATAFVMAGFLLSCFLSELVEVLSTIFYYRRGA